MIRPWFHPFETAHENLLSELVREDPPFDLVDKDLPFGLGLEDLSFDSEHEVRPYQKLWWPRVVAACCRGLHC